MHMKINISKGCFPAVNFKCSAGRILKMEGGGGGTERKIRVIYSAVECEVERNICICTESNGLIKSELSFDVVFRDLVLLSSCFDLEFYKRNMGKKEKKTD